MNIIFAISVVSLIAVTAAQQNPAPALNLRPIPINVQLRSDKLLPKLIPTARVKLQMASDKFLRSSTADPKGDSAEKEAQQVAVGAFPGNLSTASGADIEAVAFIVLIQATKDMDSDLKDTMNSVKAIDDEKKRLRDQIATIKAKQPGLKVGIQDDSRNRTVVKAGIQDDSRTQIGLKKKFPFAFTETKHLKIRLPIIVNDKQPPKSTAMTSTEVPAQVNRLQTKVDTLDEISQELAIKIRMYQDRHDKFIKMLSNILKKLSDTDSAIIANLK